jgi:hypothetical protein
MAAMRRLSRQLAEAAIAAPLAGMSEERRLDQVIGRQSDSAYVAGV